MYQQLDETCFYPVISETTGIALVFFTRQGCGSCNSWKKLLQQFIQQRQDVQVFELDAEKNMGLVHEYEIFHMPALYLFLDGEFHCQLQSEATLADLNRHLHEAIEQPAEEAP